MTKRGRPPIGAVDRIEHEHMRGNRCARRQRVKRRRTSSPTEEALTTRSTSGKRPVQGGPGPTRGPRFPSGGFGGKTARRVSASSTAFFDGPVDEHKRGQPARAHCAASARPAPPPAPRISTRSVAQLHAELRPDRLLEARSVGVEAAQPPVRDSRRTVLTAPRRRRARRPRRATAAPPPCAESSG